MPLMPRLRQPTRVRAGRPAMDVAPVDNSPQCSLPQCSLPHASKIGYDSMDANRGSCHPERRNRQDDSRLLARGGGHGVRPPRGHSRRRPASHGAGMVPPAGGGGSRRGRSRGGRDCSRGGGRGRPLRPARDRHGGPGVRGERSAAGGRPVHRAVPAGPGRHSRGPPLSPKPRGSSASPWRSSFRKPRLAGGARKRRPRRCPGPGL